MLLRQMQLAAAPQTQIDTAVRAGVGIGAHIKPALAEISGQQFLELAPRERTQIRSARLASLLYQPRLIAASNRSENHPEQHQRRQHPLQHPRHLDAGVGGPTFLSVILPKVTSWKTRPPFLGFLAGHNRPTDGHSAFEVTGLDGLVFSGLTHGSNCSRHVTERAELFSDGTTEPLELTLVRRR
jgi:hypothetical protein